MPSTRSPGCATPRGHPGLARFAAVGSAWVFVLVTLGAFTTSIGAGMAFADWPLSDGSVNPEGWLTEIAKFAEHSHRLSGATMGLITLALACGLWRWESRRWLRRLGVAALALVVFQGVLGGTRVLLDRTDLPGFEMSLGQALRIPHGILAQVFVCLLFAIATGLSRRWVAPPQSTAVAPGLRRLAAAAVALLFLQLTVAATMRHNHAGLAIPTFPLTPDGGLLPAAWDFRVGIHFAHRALALVLALVLGWLAVAVWRLPDAGRGLRGGAALLVALLVVQISLGAASVWTYRNPYFTTAHVVVGALLLANAFTLALWLWRSRIEPLPSGCAATPAAADEPALSRA